MSDHPALLLLPDIHEKVLGTFSEWNEEMNIAELKEEFPGKIRKLLFLSLAGEK
jgi:hypothetical protein